MVVLPHCSHLDWALCFALQCIDWLSRGACKMTPTSDATRCQLPRLTHLALHVRELSACIDFYRDFCGLAVVHQRCAGHQRIVWLAEPGREHDLVFVLMEGGRDLKLPADDYRHFGFAVATHEEVDDIATHAEAAGCLVWAPRQEPFPVGYYCGLCDPNGNYVEFSYGQPLGPGAPPLPPS